MIASEANRFSWSPNWAFESPHRPFLPLFCRGKSSLMGIVSTLRQQIGLSVIGQRNLSGLIEYTSEGIPSDYGDYGAVPYAAPAFRFRREGNLQKITRRAIYLYNTNPRAAAVVDTLHKSIVDSTHSGFHLHLPDKVSQQYRESISDAWDFYLQSPVAVDGSTGGEFLRLAVKTVLVEGAALIIRQNGKLRIIGAGSFSSRRYSHSTGACCDDGVVVDSMGNVAGYSVDLSYRSPLTNWRGWHFRDDFIPFGEADLVFLDGMRVGARGRPAIGLCLEELMTIDSQIESAVELIDGQNRFPGQLVTGDPSAFQYGREGGFNLNAANKGEAKQGEKKKGIVDYARKVLGMKLLILPAGQRVEALNLAKNTIAPDKLISELIEAVATSVGMTTHELRGVWQGMSLSSGNIGLSVSRAGYALHQQSLANKLIKPIFKRFFLTQYLKENINTPQKVVQEVLRKTTFTGKRYAPVDPTKIASANKMNIETGIMSRQEVIRNDGRDPDRVMRENEEWGAKSLTVDKPPEK